MNPISTHSSHRIEAAKRFGRTLLAAGENRLELVLVELQEERERLVHALLLLLGIGLFALMALAALTGAAMVLLWPYSPLTALLSVAGLYASASFWFGWRLRRLLADWQHFSATIDQIRKDRACLEQHLN